MGSKHPGIVPRGAGWQASYRNPTGKEKTGTFRRLDAKAWKQEQQTDVRHGRRGSTSGPA